MNCCCGQQGAAFEFVSPEKLIHVITHPLKTWNPITVTVRQDTGEVILGLVTPLSANQVQFTFARLVAIRGKII